MKTFALIFRMDLTAPGAQPTAEERKIYMQQWSSWTGQISARGQLAGGNHFLPEGVYLAHGGRVNHSVYGTGPASVAGYILVHAQDINEVIQTAQSCPLLNGPGNSVEIRETAAPGG